MNRLFGQSKAPVAKPTLSDASASMAHSKSLGPCRTAEPRVDAEPTLYFGRAVVVRSSTVGMAPMRVVVAPRLTRRGAAGACGLIVGAAPKRGAAGAREAVNAVALTMSDKASIP